MTTQYAKLINTAQPPDDDRDENADSNDTKQSSSDASDEEDKASGVLVKKGKKKVEKAKQGSSSTGNQEPKTKDNLNTTATKINQAETCSKQNKNRGLFANCQNIMVIALLAAIIKYMMWYYESSATTLPSYDKDWRSKVDPYNYLEDKQRFILRAALKPILDKSSTSESNTISTLIILSSNETYAANVGECVLKLVNTKNRENPSSTEIDVPSYGNNKLQLDNNLKSLLSLNDANRAVLLRHIDNISPNAIEQARLLFAYCDGENPIITDRLFIMTATSDGTDENDLREKFKSRWPDEHDFVDALMARISGHMLYIKSGQKSICE